MEGHHYILVATARSRGEVPSVIVIEGGSCVIGMASVAIVGVVHVEWICYRGCAMCPRSVLSESGQCRAASL